MFKKLFLCHIIVEIHFLNNIIHDICVVIYVYKNSSVYYESTCIHWYKDKLKNVTRGWSYILGFVSVQTESQDMFLIRIKYCNFPN